jgi:hypothetical protein
MHTITEQDWERHCAVVAGILVRLSDVKKEQQTMRLTIEEVYALIYDRDFRDAYHASRQ